MVYCTECGVLNNDANYCVRCGKKLYTYGLNQGQAYGRRRKISKTVERSAVRETLAEALIATGLLLTMVPVSVLTTLLCMLQSLFGQTVGGEEHDCFAAFRPLIAEHFSNSGFAGKLAGKLENLMLDQINEIIECIM